ncbi:MAG: NAD(P)(+) transhydrogenase (Re/Si-specific) subunit beta [Gemmatimonadales bacterium]
MEALLKLFYLAAAVCFIVGLKRLSSPATARSGNAIAAIGMLVAIVATLLDQNIVHYSWILAGMVAGGLIGGVFARTVKMTAMPQMVALLNGLGGGASALVAGAEYFTPGGVSITEAPLHVTIALSASVLVGAVTFTGSIIAFGKLQEIITGRAVTYPLQKTVNAMLFTAILAAVIWMVVAPGPTMPFMILLGLALLLGVLSVVPIGGADMPVVIALLNSYSGIAAAMTGFVIDNHGLVISGALVGASGIILTQIMCKAMNRSLTNVLFGAFGSGAGTGELGAGTSMAGKSVRSISAEDAAMMLGYSSLVVVVPGYGLAVAQAQHEVRELAELIEKRGGTVKYAIHPVAGRMPGHMNVLLAEANVSYDKLADMEQINPEFERADVSLVIGANDVVNPAARNTPSSPLYGMPILDVDKSKHIIVLKRSMRSGFAGVENELFYDPKTSMLFGDAKDSVKALVHEVKAL